jgi:DNA-directed RNA polymerase specialized sigma24 family protein
MRDARDAEDALLLETGDYDRLFAAYHEIVRQLCRIRVRADDWEDVAQNALLRLFAELKRGKRYPVPFRVVVRKVVTWTIADYAAGRPTDVPLPDGWDAPGDGDPFAGVGEREHVEQLFAELPPGDRKVATLRYLEGLEIDEIAERLGKRRNAVDQALWRVHAKLRRLLDAA